MLLWGMTCAEPDGVGGNMGSGTSLENHSNIGFLSNTGPDPLKNHKAAKPEFNGTPAKRHLIAVSLAGYWWPANSGILIGPPLLKLKDNNKKKRCWSLTPSAKMF